MDEVQIEQRGPTFLVDEIEKIRRLFPVSQGLFAPSVDSTNPNYSNTTPMDANGTVDKNALSTTLAYLNKMDLGVFNIVPTICGEVPS